MLSAENSPEETLQATIQRLEAELEAERSARLQAEHRADDFRRLLDQLPALVSTARGTDLVYDFYNRLSQQALGDMSLIGVKAVDAFPEMVESGFYALIQQQLEQDTPWIGRAVPSPYLGVNGRKHYFDVIYQPLHDAAGRVDGLLTFSYDVTETVEARQQAEASETKYRELADAVDQLVWTLQGDGETVEYTNARWTAYTGLATLPSRLDWAALIHPADRPGVARQAAAISPQGMPYEFEARFRGTDGAYRWFLGRMVPQKDANGAVVRWFGTATDIHARKLLEMELHQANSELEAQAEALRANNEELATQAEELSAQQEELLDLYERLRRHADEVEAEVARRTEDLQAANEELTAQAEELCEQSKELGEQTELTNRIMHDAPAGISFLDRHLIFRRANAVHLSLWGRSEDQVLGKPFFEVFGPAVEAEFGERLQTVLATGRPYRATRFPVSTRREGVERLTYWDFAFTPVDDADGARQGLLILSIDVSDRVENERLHAEQISQLREMDRYKDEFLSVISHELRTPLNFITGFASTLQDEVQGPLNEAQHGALGKILNGADRMLMLVDDILDFAKIQSGRFELAPAPTPYRPLVEEVLGLLKPLADAKGLTLAVSDMPALSAMIDGGRIAQVLTNLVGNAIKFTDAGGVTVGAWVQDRTLVTAVRDTGWGIAPEHVSKLFHRFQQLDMSATRRAGGTGLGLAICKALVEVHGGDIGVESEPGQGSTFWFKLPLERAE